MNVTALADPQKPCRESRYSRTHATHDEFYRDVDEGDEESCCEVEGVGDGGEEELCFDFPGAGGCVDGGEDEGHVADGDVGGADGGDSCLFIDEGEDGEEGVGGRE